MSAVATQSLTRRLAERVAAVDAAKRVVDDRERELVDRRRELAAAREEQTAYLHATGAGATADQALEGRLSKVLSQPGVIEREGRLSDSAAEARLEGAQAAHAAAERDLRGFAANHLTEIVTEMRRGEEEERRAVLTAARDLARALHPMRQRWKRVHGVHVLAGRPESAPPPPFEEAARALAAIERA